MRPAPRRKPPDPSALDPRLDTDEAFRRFVDRVWPRTLRTLAWWRVPERDREDVLQEILLAASKRRASFDPARGRYEDWLYGFVVLFVLNYRKTASRRNRREEWAPSDLPDVAIPTLGIEERAMLRRMLYQCFDELGAERAAIVLAFDVDGIRMETIAAAHGISVSTAYDHYNDAKERLQKALDRVRGERQAHGLAVLPITLDQLIGSESALPDVPAETMERVWEYLDRRMAEDAVDAVPGTGGSDPGVLVSGVRRLAPRTLRAIFGPRTLPALTFAVGAAGGSGVTYALMRDQGAAHNDRGAQGASASAVAVLAPDPAPTDTAPPSTGRSSAAPEPPELGADGGAAASERDATGAEQALFDQANTAYGNGNLEGAIKAFERHEAKYPRGTYAPMRERLLTLALIRSGRVPEARQRIERLRRINPKSPLLRELDAALPPNN